MPRLKVLVLSLLAVAVATTTLADLTALWTVIIDEISFYRVTVIGPDDEIYWTGAVGEPGDNPWPEMLRRYQADGTLDWEKKLAGESLWAMVVAADGSGVLVGGADSESFPGTPWVARHDAAKGIRKWRLELDALDVGLITAIGIGPDGDIYVAGRSEDGATFDVFVARLMEAGNQKSAEVVWLVTFDIGASDEATSLAVDPDSGEIFVGGHTSDAAARQAGADNFLAALSPDGDLDWTETYDYAATSGALFDLKISPNGKWIYAVGRLEDDGSGDRSFFFQRFRTSNGKAKKPKRYNYSSSGNQWANALAVTPDGKTVFITGHALSAGQFTSVLIRANNRGKQQEVVQDAINGEDSRGVDVALDSDGNVLVAGPSGAGSFLRKYQR